MTSCLVSFSVTVLMVFVFIVFNVFVVFFVMSSCGPYVFVSYHVSSNLWINPFKQLRVRSLWPPATILEYYFLRILFWHCCYLIYGTCPVKIKKNIRYLFITRLTQEQPTGFPWVDYLTEMMPNIWRLVYISARCIFPVLCANLYHV